jgi:NADH dehydrogenase [ubiquinone] 1 alpha subcomplex assembly factor 3
MSNIASAARPLRSLIARNLQSSQQKILTPSRIRPSSTNLRHPLQPNSYLCCRCLHNTRNLNASPPPKSRDRGPASKEDTQTDFGVLNVLGGTPPPATSIDATTNDGFAFSNNTKVSGTGVMLVSGEVFRWRPWVREKSAKSGDGAQKRTLLNAKGQWDVDESAWGVLDLVWPKPGKLRP